MPTALLTPILLAVLGAATGVSLLALLRSRRRARTLAEDVLVQTEQLQATQSELAALIACSRRIGERLNESERLQRTLQKQLDRLQASGDDQAAVQQAMKFLRNGLALEEVTRLCELSQGEVEILQRLVSHQDAA